ncbi:MAG: hypothetical protein ACTSQQ_02940 [Candidatus Helarchaeota archaeon]
MQPSAEENFFFMIQALIFTGMSLLLSWIQYFRVGRRITDKKLRKKVGLRLLAFRYFAGFCMGCFDHLFMVLGGFHNFFWPIAYWYVISLYTTFMLLIPPSLIKEKHKWFIPLWLFATITFSAGMEMAFRIFFFCGYLCYPPGWTAITTIIFYFDIFVLGTFIATLSWRYTKKKVEH